MELLAIATPLAAILGAGIAYMFGGLGLAVVVFIVLKLMGK